jgi:hypothetical protein
MRRLGSTWGGGLVAALGVATAMACAQSPDESGYGLGGAPDAGNDGSVSLGDGAASTSSSGTSGKPSDGGGSSGTSGGNECTGKLVINEMMAAGASKPNEEFIELYSPNDCDVSLASFSIKYKPSSGAGTGTELVAFASNEKVTPRGFLLIATTDFAGARDVTMTAGMRPEGGSIALIEGANKTVDAVAWGDANAGFTEGSRAPAATGGDSVARKSDGVDTNNNGADFAVVPTPTPGKPN